MNRELGADRVEPVTVELRDKQRSLRLQNRALLKLAKSESFGRGDLASALREITEVSSRILGTERVSVWFFNEDLCLANSESAVISIHATRTNCRNPSIFRSSNAATKLKPGYSKTNVFSPTQLSHYSVLFACLTLTSAELHATIGV